MDFPIIQGITNERGEFYSWKKNTKNEHHSEVFQFIELYANTVNSTDIHDLKLRCADHMLFSGKDRPIYIPLERLHPYVQKMTEEYKLNGYKETHIKKIEHMGIDNKYHLLKIYIDMIFRRNGQDIIIENLKATYIIMNENGNWKAIVQIDHQELPEILKEKGICN